MIAPNDLYALPAEKPGPLSGLISTEHTFIPEVGGWSPEVDVVTSDRIRIDILKEVTFDHRHIWRLSTVWFDDLPVMIMQNAGREGDDHASRLITDAARYQDMVAHLKELLPSLPEPWMGEYGTADNITNLTCFYRRSFDVATRTLIDMR